MNLCVYIQNICIHEYTCVYICTCRNMSMYMYTCIHLYRFMRFLHCAFACDGHKGDLFSAFLSLIAGSDGSTADEFIWWQLCTAPRLKLPVWTSKWTFQRVPSRGCLMITKRPTTLGLYQGPVFGKFLSLILHFWSLDSSFHG